MARSGTPRFEGTIHFLQQGVIVFHILDGPLGNAQVRDAFRNLFRMRGEHPEYVITQFGIGAVQIMAYLEDIGGGTHQDDGIVVGSLAPVPADELAYEQMPDGVEKPCQDSL